MPDEMLVEGLNALGRSIQSMAERQQAQAALN
jgi:hypothetical protein